MDARSGRVKLRPLPILTFGEVAGDGRTYANWEAEQNAPGSSDTPDAGIVE
jgi:hypothetical protein